MNDLMESRKQTKFIRTLYGDKANIFTFCIASPENPMGKEATADENKKSVEKLKWYLKKYKLHYYPIDGSYGGNIEHSFLIGNISIDLCKSLFGKNGFNQATFIFGVVDKEKKQTVFHLYEQQENGDFHDIESKTKIIYAEDFEDFYSKYNKFKFSIPFDKFNEGIIEIGNVLEEMYGWNEGYRDYLKEMALREGYTPKSYWMNNGLHLLTEEEYRIANPTLRDVVMKLI